MKVNRFPVGYFNNRQLLLSVEYGEVLVESAYTQEDEEEEVEVDTSTSFGLDGLDHMIAGLTAIRMAQEFKLSMEHGLFMRNNSTDQVIYLKLEADMYFPITFLNPDYNDQLMPNPIPIDDAIMVPWITTEDSD